MTGDALTPETARTMLTVWETGEASYPAFAVDRILASWTADRARLAELESDVAADAHLMAEARAGAQEAQTQYDLLAARLAEVTAQRDALVPLAPMIEALVEESGKEVEWGHEDSFRRGEWFEESELAQIAAARATLTETPPGPTRPTPRRRPRQRPQSN